MRGLEPLAEQHHGAHLLDRGDLGQGHDEAVRQPAGRRRARGRATGCRGDGWAARATSCARRTRTGEPSRPPSSREQRTGARPRARPPRVVAVAVAVLEVQPQVLDRLALELGEHARPDLLDESRRQACDPGHRGRVAAVLVDRRHAPPAGLRDEVGRRPGRRGRTACAPADACRGHRATPRPAGRRRRRAGRRPRPGRSRRGRPRPSSRPRPPLAQVGQPVVRCGLPHRRSRAMPPSG